MRGNYRFLYLALKTQHCPFGCALLQNLLLGAGTDTGNVGLCVWGELLSQNGSHHLQLLFKDVALGTEGSG